MFHYRVLPVAERIINFSLWFAGSLSSITNPTCQADLTEVLLGIRTPRTPSVHLEGMLLVVAVDFSLLFGFSCYCCGLT